MYVGNEINLIMHENNILVTLITSNGRKILLYIDIFIISFRDKAWNKASIDTKEEIEIKSTTRVNTRMPDDH